MMVSTLALPTFDLHRVEEALKTNHRLYNGQPMTKEEINKSIMEYREFLAQIKASGNMTFRFPGYAIDRVWHTHMCETKQYREDCLAYFGEILEHSNNICENGAGE